LEGLSWQTIEVFNPAIVGHKPQSAVLAMPSRTVVQLLDFIPDAWRSMEQLLVGLASRLRDEGCRTVHVFTGEPGERMHAALQALDSPWLVVSDPMTARDARRITPLLSDMNPAMIQTHFLSLFNPLLRRIKHGSGARRLVITDHSSGRASAKAFPGSLLSRLRTRHAATYIDQVIGVSQFVCRRDVEDVYFPADKVRCIHNGVDVRRFAPAATPRADSRPFTIGFIGYHIPEKGLGTLLDAAARLAAQQRDFRLEVAGTGPHTDAFRRQAASLGLLARTRFVGQLADTVPFYQRIDVLAVPSEWEEAFGFVVAEAAACGTCVVCSDAGGMPEIVGHRREAGIVIPRGRADTLAETLAALIDAPAECRAIGLRARERMVRQFSIDATVDAYTKTLLPLMR